MIQLNKAQAINLFKSEIWKQMSEKDFVVLQLAQDLSCVPYRTFKSVLKRVLGRNVSDSDIEYSSEYILNHILGGGGMPNIENLFPFLSKEEFWQIVNATN